MKKAIPAEMIQIEISKDDIKVFYLKRFFLKNKYYLCQIIKSEL